jgi:photosystem II stability/assembly factor-like uncharacterized protein
MKKTIITLCTLLVLSFSVQSQWITINLSTISSLNCVFFVNDQTGFISSGVLRKTTNGGFNWNILDPFSSQQIYSVYFFNASTGLISGYGKIAKTTNGGMNWSLIMNGLPDGLYTLSLYNNSRGICCGSMGAVYYTTNGGDNWSVGGPNMYSLSINSSFMLNGSTGYCGGVNDPPYPNFGKTTNGGANWEYSLIMAYNYRTYINGIYFFDDQNGIVVSGLYPSVLGGISRTTNGGVNWTHQVFPNVLKSVDFPSANIGYCVGDGGTIMKSTNGGVNWNSQISGTASLLKSIFFVDTLLGFAVGGNGVLLKTTNGGITGFSGKSNEIPSAFSLSQNYPNPFNPVTKIKYDIPSKVKSERSNVELIVFDVLGREIATLVNEKLSPGTYEAQWDASNYPSGVYFYKLTTQDFSETKKMVLIK